MPETESAFQELRKRGSSPDITTLNAMVSIYGKRQLTAKVNEILNFMKESGFSPSLTTYNSLINMYNRGGDPERGEEILREIKAKGRQPDLFSYKLGASKQCRNGT